MRRDLSSSTSFNGRHFRVTMTKSASSWTSPIKSTRSSWCESMVLSCGPLEKSSLLQKSFESTSVPSGISLSFTRRIELSLRPKVGICLPISSHCQEMRLWGNWMILSSELVSPRYIPLPARFQPFSGSLFHHCSFTRQHARHVRQRKSQSQVDR